MKTTIKLLALIISGSTFFTACKNHDGTTAPTVYYQQQDQVGRPAINTVFNAAADKEIFNQTAPSTMGAAFQAKFQAKLLALNPGYTTNLLTLDPAAFTTVLATDVLNVSTTGPTTFYDGVAANTLSGRKLDDDVIDVELILIFGGPANELNPTLTSDGVAANDKAFLTAFPYEATPW
ncbi:MAG: DUF4331 family protein [Ginsengibacter sp.]